MAPKPKSKTGKTQRQIVLENAEEIIDLIAENKSYKQISEKFGVHVSEMVYFVNDSEYRARALAAKKIASYDLLERAEKELMKIQDDDTAAAVRRQCELSQFAAYLAKVKNREELDLNYKEKDNNQQQIVVIPADYMNQKKIA